MADTPGFTTRPELAGTFGMVASTHWLASAAGMAVLEHGGNAFDVRDQSCVRGPRRGQGLLSGTAARSRGEPGRQTADAAEQRLRHRGGDLVERFDGRVRSLRPGGEVRGPRGVPLLLRGVLPVVAGQVQLAEVEERVPAV